jgi:endonuclease/exonuclease/phosphatase (EEP) superfamily protein YafD
MDSENMEVILIGDFNCDWSQIANRVTEISKTQIDLAFTNKPEIVFNCF